MRLVREYMNDPISHHPCTDNDYIHHVIRLRSLWKYGLPDSLESLLLCRINEHMFMLQQPKQQYSTLEYNPIKVKSSSEYKSCISTTSLCTYSLPFMNIMSCERHTQNMNSSPDMRGEEVSKINSTVITTTPIASRSLYTLSSSVTSKMNTNQLNENSQQLVSINKSSQLCSICDNKITSSPVSNNQKLSPEKKSLYSGNHKLLKKTQCSVYSCKDCRRNFVTSFKPDYCYHNSYFSSSCEHDRIYVYNVIASIFTPSNVPTYLYDHRLCCIYSDSDYLCSDPLLLLSSSNYHTLVNRNKLNCCNQHRYNGHQTQQHQHLHQSDILCRPYRISTTTTSSSPCYRKVLFHCKEAQSKFVYHPSAYTPTKSSLNTLNRNNDQTTIVVTEDQYSSKLKLSTKKFRNVDFQTKIFSPLLLTLPCHSTVNHSMSSSFAWKSNPSSDSASYYSSSSSPSSTSFSRTNSSPLSVASN
ncbi:unnamed protein product [Heterobilharzia americana]|nr:unnamed protein product [Heterobilharzia americana]